MKSIKLISTMLEVRNKTNEKQMIINIFCLYARKQIIPNKNRSRSKRPIKCNIYNIVMNYKIIM